MPKAERTRETVVGEFARSFADAAPGLVGRLTRYCRDPELAEDAVQEAALRACDRWEELDRLRSLEAWLWRVAVNLVHDHHRRARLERHHRRRESHRLALPHHDEDVVESLWIHAALGGLPERQRVVLIERFLEDRSVADVAEEMDCPTGTVKSLTHRGSRTLRTAIA